MKIRGLRVELGEVEHHIQASLQGVSHVVVDTITSDVGTNLAAYLWFSDEKRDAGSLADMDASELFIAPEPELESQITALVGKLTVAIPRYMIPTVFIPCRYLLFSTSGKLDRKILKLATKSLSADQLARFSRIGSKKRMPANPSETQMQSIWTQILQLPASSIGRDDSFLALGGNSITAIQLAAVLRDAGLVLTVKDIFDDPRLSAVAAKASQAEEAGHSQAERFSLLQDSELETIISGIHAQCQLEDGQDIEDAYPTTSLQEGLIALAVKQPGSYITKHIYRLADEIDADRFRAAWERTLELCSNLRTRIVVQSGKSIQAVISETPTWELAGSSDLPSFVSGLESIEMQYGSGLCRYALVEEQGGERHFVLVMHHAIFDGWSLNVVLSTLYRAYWGETLRPQEPFSAFINYIESLDQSAAADYWRVQLDGAQRASFPPTGRSSGDAVYSTFHKSIAFPQRTDTSITKATILRAAWAVILARYSDTDDVCFGTTVSGRQASLNGIEGMAGPTVATVPIRIRLEDKQVAISTFLLNVQNQASDMVLYEQYGLQNISAVSSNAKEACDFSSIFLIQPVQNLESSDPTDLQILSPADTQRLGVETALDGYFSYPLVGACLVFDDHVGLQFTYHINVVTESRLASFACQFEHIVQQLCAQGEGTIASLSVSGPRDVSRAISWNGEDPEIVDECVHQLVEQQARLRPNAQAICAWDGDFTYAELDRAANRLANLLVNDYNVKSEDLVHVCFEKSAWFTVAILGINKAGAAWVPLDQAHPIQRQQQIIQQTKAKVVVASPSNGAMCSAIVAHVIELSPTLDQQLKSLASDWSSSPPLCDISPRNAAYVLFTSGSTGNPKGVVLEHRAVCTSQTAISRRLRITPEARLLQFSAYVFDVCVGDIIGSLISGACHCVPSEEARMNGLKEFIRDKNVTWAFLTPTFAATLRPEDVPSLEFLLFIGEAVSRDLLDTWFGKLRLVNAWGPAESCVFSTLHEVESASESPLTIGRPVGARCWIVDADDPQRLAPVGCVGELVVQGPTLLRGYLHDAEKTAAAVVTSLPEWAPRRGLSNWDRFYKTGDLCFYNDNGTIEFVSRKDTQVKIRGLRVELGEVEHHIRTALDTVQQVVVDVFRGEAGTNLVSYLYFNDEKQPAGASSNDLFLPVTPELEDQIISTIGRLNVALPRYMIPTMFIPCRYLPSITSGKLDRKRLRTMTAALDAGSLATYSLVQSKKRAPRTSMEARMQSVWAAILKIPVKSIGLDDSFLSLGGDSIRAIQLVTAAHEAGFKVTVKDIFDDPRLSAVSSKAVRVDGEQSYIEEPFVMVPSDRLNAVISDIRDQCQLGSGQEIEDAYPCTQLQEGLMALSTKQPGSYIAKYVYRIHNNIDLTRFRAAWERTVELCGNLRTRIVMHNGASIQALIREGAAWETEATQNHTLRSFMESLDHVQMPYGSRLCRYALVENDGETHFVLVLHHAVFDGWSMNVVLGTLYSAYQELEIPRLYPFATFINYTKSIDQTAASEYWKQQLDGAKQSTFPQLERKAGAGPVTSNNLRTTIKFPGSSDTSITKATILRAAWAIVLARYSDTDDICFGTTVSGRQAPITGVERMTGLALATVPVRVRIDRQQAVKNFSRTSMPKLPRWLPTSNTDCRRSPA